MNAERSWVALVPRALVVVHDLLMVALTWVALRWLAGLAGAPPPASLAMELAITVMLQGLILWRVGLYRGLWRFASLPDLANLVRAAVTGLVFIMMALLLLGLLPEVPRRVLVPYPFLLVLLLGSPRMAYRLWKDARLTVIRQHDAQRVLVLGAGRAAEALLRDLRSDGRYWPVGLLDDQPGLRGAKVQGVPVLGNLDELPELARETAAKLIVIAMPEATVEEMRRIVALCDDAGLPFRRVPRLGDVIEAEPSGLRLNEVAIEDLLGREPVSFEWQCVMESLAGRRVLITGGAGSIGSELARQCAQAGVARLVLMERAELPLDEILQELAAHFPAANIQGLLADCGEAAACRLALAEGIDFVFHAAACKQVPLLESQVREALRNNVLATAILARACGEAGVGNFVLISTDKAIQPANVLGASKRLAELACQAVLAGSGTRLGIVRFGNVIGSSGSVVPLFRRQIAEGGPVTVTDPEVTRYFMTIPEACQLILQTLRLDHTGSVVYTLDMGRPVAIRELAEQMIRLAGKRPGIDIAIRYTGLRPGEKLHEDLFHPGERPQPTRHPRILETEPASGDNAAMLAMVDTLTAALAAGATDIELRELLRRAVPEYTAPHP